MEIEPALEAFVVACGSRVSAPAPDCVAWGDGEVQHLVRRSAEGYTFFLRERGEEYPPWQSATSWDLARLLIALTAGRVWRSEQRLPRLNADPPTVIGAGAVVVSGDLRRAVVERPGVDRANGLFLSEAHQLARMTQHPFPDVLTALRAVDGAPVFT